MSYTINKIDVWAADIPNQAGTLSRLLEGVSKAGGQLEFMIARKVNDGTSRVFLAPIKGPKQQKAATGVGLARAAGMRSLRVEGPDRAGLGAKITQAVAEKGINLRGASAAAVGKKAVFYLAVESDQDLKAAIRAVRNAISG